jgi:catechol 2,3-dioxygenase-like lactoylglutathione lyase family enzyme
MDVVINLDVDDLEKAVRFYADAFGLRPARRSGAFVERLGNSVPICLLAKAAATPAADTTSQPRNYERHWTPVHLDFVIVEIAPAVEKGSLPERGRKRPLPFTSGASSRYSPIHSAMIFASSSFSAAARPNQRAVIVDPPIA